MWGQAGVAAGKGDMRVELWVSGRRQREGCPRKGLQAQRLRGETSLVRRGGGGESGGKGGVSGSQSPPWARPTGRGVSLLRALGSHGGIWSREETGSELQPLLRAILGRHKKNTEDTLCVEQISTYGPLTGSLWLPAVSGCLSPPPECTAVQNLSISFLRMIYTL